MNIHFYMKMLSILLALFTMTSCKLNEKNSKNIDVFTPTDKTEKLSNFIEEALKTNPIIPSVSVVVVDENGPVFTKSFGYADYENKIIANEETQFYIASCTKSFNGLLANILAEEGTIDLTKEITAYKPFKNFHNKTVFEDVSIQDLISHQSGLENPYLTFRLAYSGEYEHEEILQLIEEDTHKSDTGKDFSYTNLGYYLLDAILQAELEKSWKKLLQAKVFEPLKMEKTTAYISKSDPKKLALPHLGAFKDSIYIAQLMKTDKTMHPAGGLLSTTEDIAKYLSFYINEGKFQGKQVYSKDLVQSSYKKQASTENTIGKAFNCHGYGSGWLSGKLNQEDLVLHYGAYEGFRAHLSFIPEKKIGVAVFINHEYAMPFINQIVNYAYNLYLENETIAKNLEQSLKPELSELLTGYQDWISIREEKMRGNTWDLSLQKNDYSGKYHNNKMGTLEVTTENEEFIVTCGNMKSVALPHADQNCLWVKLTSQMGETICFSIENEEVKSIQYKDNNFSKLR